MKWCFLVLTFICSVPAFSKLRLPAIINNNMVLQQQSQVKIWGWANPYEKVTVTTSWDGKTYSCTGSDNAQWLVTVQTPAAGGPYSVTINDIVLSNVLIGEVWICSGQSNMAMSGKPVKDELPHALNNHIRFFHIPKTTARTPQENCPGNWTICDSNTLKTFSAVAYYFGKRLQKELNVPIGLISAAWGGTSAEVWTPDSIVYADPDLKSSATYIAPSGQCPNQPGYAFNGMIAPVTNFNIAGVIWYQGENNTVRPVTYPKLFTSMMDAWRRAFHKELPFYYVQIAPFHYKDQNSGALLREAQLKCMQHPHTGMVVITDLVDDLEDVHPVNKWDVGLRLANWALAETYHKQGFAYKSPVYTGAEVENNKVIVQFDQPVIIKGKNITELMIAGEDKIFYPATAIVNGNTLVATCKQVKRPVALRFGFSDTARGNLFSTAGLPVTPFRTDDWAVDVTSFSEPALIPQPHSLQKLKGQFAISAATTLSYNTREAQDAALLLNEFLQSNYNIQLPVRQRKTGTISIAYDPKAAPESYSLQIQPGSIHLKGSAAGLFYGIQTLQQLFPANQPVLPALIIKDQPRFKHRGLMLDVCRHFFSINYVKKFIDQMAQFKLNSFHWHLTDDQGWRIEIKRYPALQTTAAWRDASGNKYGGYYTQEQVKEIVAYAAKRFINVIPEIEMPGHSSAALAAYPYLGCTGGPYKVQPHGGVFKDVYCAGNDSVFNFLQGVIDEVVELFPGQYIHIGGDECPKDRWKQCVKCQARMKKEGLRNEHELQSYFVQHMEKYINSKGRKMIGWDEILEGGLAPNATVMSWRGEKGGIEAARLKHDVIMSPYTYLYFDYYQGKPATEPKAIGGYLPIPSVYAYEPLGAGFTKEEHAYVKGVQANIWTEYIADEKHLDYMAFPRALIVSEIGWGPSGKDYDHFMQKLRVRLQALDRQPVNFRIPEPIGLKDSVIRANTIDITLQPSVQGASILYSIDGTEPTQPLNSTIRLHLLPQQPVVLKTVTILPSGRKSAVYTATYKKADTRVE